MLSLMTRETHSSLIVPLIPSNEVTAAIEQTLTRYHKNQMKYSMMHWTSSHLKLRRQKGSQKRMDTKNQRKGRFFHILKIPKLRLASGLSLRTQLAKISARCPCLSTSTSHQVSSRNAASKLNTATHQRKLWMNLTPSKDQPSLLPMPYQCSPIQKRAARNLSIPCQEKLSNMLLISTKSWLSKYVTIHLCQHGIVQGIEDFKCGLIVELNANLMAKVCSSSLHSDITYSWIHLTTRNMRLCSP